MMRRLPPSRVFTRPVRGTRSLGAALFLILAFAQGCYTRQASSLGTLETPSRLRVTRPDGFLVHRLPADPDGAVLPPCQATRMEGTLVRFTGDTLVFGQATIGSVVVGAPRCSGISSEVFVVPADHSALLLEAVHFDPLGSLMTAIILAPLIAIGVVAVVCALTPCMS